MQKCPFCDYENENLDSIRIHNTKRHKGTSLSLRLAMFHDNVRPLCKCGCGEETRFINVHDGFNDFVRGHQARVHNNWGHNKEALDKSHATNKARLSSGETVIWNKGLTKETSEAVAAYGRGTSESFSQDKRDRYSVSMRENRKNGTIPTLSGPESSQWKGGVSTVQQLARSYTFNVWNYPKMHAAQFTCQHCKKISGEDGCILNVHHDSERFSQILQKARAVLGDVDSFEKTQQYAQWVADYHIQNDVSGVVLCEGCHRLEHGRVGEQWFAS